VVQPPADCADAVVVHGTTAKPRAASPIASVAQHFMVCPPVRLLSAKSSKPAATRLARNETARPVLEGSMAEKPDLDRELDRLQRHLPNWGMRLMRWLRSPSSRLVRIPLAILLVLGGFIGFLPILGFWMIPLGLALIAQDVPPLRSPLARFLGFVNRKLAFNGRS
jgi:hypothetical protein